MSMLGERTMWPRMDDGDWVTGGHLYMRTNEVRNAVIHYHRAPEGALTEVQRILTPHIGFA